MSKFTQKHNLRPKSLIFGAVLTLLVISLTSFIPTTAIAEENPVTLSCDGDTYTLHWKVFSNDPSTFDGYVISINGIDTNLSDYYFCYYNITSLLTDVGNYTITVYAKQGGNLIFIGSCQTAITRHLDNIENLNYSNGTLSWSHVENADGYIVFIGNIYIGITLEENMYIDNKLALSGDFDVIILPYSENEYLLTPVPTIKTISKVSAVNVDLPIYAFNYAGNVLLSWQWLDNVSFNYVLSSTDYMKTGTTNSCCLSFENLEDGTYFFALYGKDSSFDYNFGCIEFTIENGQVRYD